MLHYILQKYDILDHKMEQWVLFVQAHFPVGQARGKSGRIVIEIDPELKKELYFALTADDSTLKDWFIKKAKAYIEYRLDPQLTFNNFVRDESEE